MLIPNFLMKRYLRFPKIDIFIAVLLFISLTAIITSISQDIYYQSHVDSAQFVDILSRIKEYGLPYSQINWSVRHALETVVIQPPEQVCSSSLKMDDVHLTNLLERHAYFLLFPLSLVSYLLDELLTVSLFHAAKRLQPFSSEPFLDSFGSQAPQARATAELQKSKRLKYSFLGCV